MQPVTWLQPGVYAVYWKSCCRSVGSNFSNNPNGLFAAVSYNPDIPSSSPQFYDIPVFNFVEGEPITYNINMEDPDGHKQDYTLEIPYGLSADVYDQMIETGFQLTSNGTITWADPLVGKWLVNVRLREQIDGYYTGAYIEREFIIDVVSSGDNSAPAFHHLHSKAVRAGETLTFEVEASDSEGQNVIMTAYGSPFDKGAVFNQTVYGSMATGSFTWSPTENETGTYQVQFAATDDHSTPLSSQVNISITVAECTEYSVGYDIVARPCEGSDNGQVRLSANGGIAPLSYSLDGGSTFQALPEFGSLGPGSYSAIVMDAINCVSAPIDIFLEEIPLPQLSLVLPSDICENAVALELTGGSPTGGMYSGAGVENGYFYPEQAGLGVHTLFYSYTDTNGCSNTISRTITVNEAPVADTGSDAVVYPGKGVNSCTTLTGGSTGGVAPFTYTWSTGESSQTIEVCPIDTTTYTLVVSDINGCHSSDDIVVYTDGGSPGNGNGNGNSNGNGNGNGKGKGNGKGQGTNAKSMVAHGFEDETTIAGVMIYPNPMTEASPLTVAFKEADEVTVDIIALSGRIIKQLYQGPTRANQVFSFDVDNKHGDIYVCRITTTNEVYSFKVIVR
ncbi:PKD domain containing protein [Fulvivirga imtechensis AK7]|uniref:PKD domain containing protein n=2 Tax=Fulvivirga TaxID=396811 RepID=L8JWJ4_9BACT|nr:PKD domain containing protein [Fulvivirga imtechensis AK7]